MFSTLNLSVILIVSILVGAYCANEKQWEGVIACIFFIFATGVALYFRILGGL